MSEAKAEIKWSSLQSELYREYVFPEGDVIRISEPQCLHVRGSGAHNVVDANDVVHYVPTGWRSIRWKVRDGRPFVDF
jgi:hypothetical protein